MTSSNEGEDRELLVRYRRASDADPRTPSPAVRAAILEEGRRVAKSLSPEPHLQRRLPSRWKMTAWGTAAAALLAALIIAPRLWNETPPMPRVTAVAPPVPFNQVAKTSEPIEPAAEPRPVVPVMPMPAPSPESIPPRVLADAPTLRRVVPPPPPVHVPEQSVEITRLLDQGAAINERDADGRTPLMLAIGQNQIDTVRLLLDRGADPNVADNRGVSPLQLARQSKFDDIADLLIKAGAR